MTPQGQPMGRLMRSTLPGARWPALLKGQAAQLAATLYQLKQIQWWGAEALALISHALRTAPYYQKRYAALGFGAAAASVVEHWADAPLFTRTDAQAAGAELYSSAVPAAQEAVEVAQTSGSTGHPYRCAPRV